MKKILFGCLAIASLWACNSGGDKKETTETKTEETPAVTDNTKNPDYKKGLALVTRQGSLCLTCHTIDQKLTGPPYREVANKYASYPDTIVAHLARKVIKGGTGVWGEVAMPPNANVTQEEAEAMVKYILLLKK
jgi:Cytochrome c551/c552